MASKRLSEKLAEELELIRAEIKVITEAEEPDPDTQEHATWEADLDRAESLGEAWDEKKAEYDRVVKREKHVDEIARTSLDLGNREDGATSGRRGPEFKRTRDAFETDADLETLMRSARRPEDVNFDAESTIDRAHLAVDQTPNFVTDATRARLHELLERDEDKNTPLIARHIVLTGAPEYREQFKEYVRTGGRHIPELLRAAMSLTAGNGGVLVPHYLDPTIILTNAGVYAGTIRSIATIKTIAVKQWEGVTSAGVTAQWTGEATATTDDSPTFVQPTIVAKKADAWLTGSYEVFEDTGFGNELGRLLADAKARLEEAAFATGNTGATIPRGVVAAVAAVTASIVTSATTGAFVVGDVHNVSNAVNPRQEQNLGWLAHKAIYSKVRQFDTSGGGGFWANLNVGQPPLLLGAPALKSAAMTSVVGNGTNILLAGDFSQYYIIDRIGMSVIYDPLVKTTASGAAPTGQAGWYAHWRVGADVVNADAFRLLQLNQVAAAVALA
jgi:HK97 family phage major capsid protein